MIRQYRIISAPYPIGHVFDIAANVEAYPAFLPGCIGARIKDKQDQTMLVENVYRFGMLRQKFITLATFSPNASIAIRSHPSERLKLYINWDFMESADELTEVHFEIILDHKFLMLEEVISKIMGQNAQKVEKAFLKRAKDQTTFKQKGPSYL